MKVFLRVPPLLALVLLVGCAASGARAPIENRDGKVAGPAPATAAPPSATVAAAPATALPDAPAPVAIPLGDEDPDTGAATSQLALAEPTESVAAVRQPAAQSLLAAAMQAATRGDWDRAQSSLERAVKLAPNDDALWRQLAYTHYRKGDHVQALEVAQRALSLSRTDATRAESWNLVGDIETDRGNAAAAAAARRKASALQP